MKLETLAINSLITDSPIPIAILDKNLKFISYSDVWLKEFGGFSTDLRGKDFLTVLSDSPIALQQALKECLKGKTQINNGEKFIHSDGRIQWLKWKISPWKDFAETLGGLILVLEDITEEEREKELLLQAEEVAKIGGWEVNMLKNEIYWSDITKNIHEVPEDYIPNLEGGINFYKEGEHREQITKFVTAAISEGRSWDTELIIVTAKGNKIWVRAKGEAELVNGKCIRLFGTFQDIDVKKKAELRYKHTAERLKIATGAANIGIWEYNILENTLVWDNNMYQLYGVKKEDFSGEYEAWEAGIHPGDKERGSIEISKAVSGEKEFDTEFRVLWPNGTIRNIRAIATTERNRQGKALKMIGVNWDITELKRARLKLERHKECFSKTFEKSTTGMALVAIDGTFMQVNKGLCKILGYTEEELLTLTFQDITYPEDLDKDLELFQDVLDNKKDSYQLEKRY